MASFESISQLALPPEVESRVQELRHRQSQGKLSASERQELGLLVEAQETLGMIRNKARSLVSVAPAPIQPARSIRNGLPVVQVPAGTPAIDLVALRRLLEEEDF